MGQTRAEQETVIRWDEDEQLVRVWSASPVTWRKMARLGIRPTRETVFEGKGTGKFYQVPLARLRWRVLAEGARRRPGNPEALRRARQTSARQRLHTDSPGKVPEDGS